MRLLSRVRPFLLATALAALAPLPVQADEWVPPANDPVEGPIVRFMRSNAGWQATISLPGPAMAIAWRFGEQGPWQDTGLLDAVDPRTRRRMPNPSFPLDANAPGGTVYVRYVDAAGASLGPYPVAFEPMTELVRDQRNTLEMISGSWVSFRQFNGLILYYTMLVSYRCAIQELRIGLDLPKPDRVITLPPCNLADPASIPSKYEPLLRVPVNTRSASVQIIYRDGSASAVKVFPR